MSEKETIDLIQPKPYEVVEVKFSVFGKIPKSWLLYGRYGLDLSLMDINGHEFMGTSAEVIPGLFSKFRKKVKFYSSVDLSHYEIPKHPQGLIIEISDCNNHSFLVPLIVKGSDENYEINQKELKEKLSNTVKKILKYKEDWNNYRNELQKIRKGVVHKKEILEGVFEILQQSEEHYKPFSHSEEDLEEKVLEEKYRDAINWYGPLLRGIAGRMDGFEFRIYSDDHGKHFHVTHKGKGINARFSFPEIDLINYKGCSNTMGSKEKKKIRDFFKRPENFQKLDNEFRKRYGVDTGL